VSTYERARRAIHETAMLLEDMAKENLKLLEEIERISRDPGTPRRERVKKKLEAIRDNANRVRKETRR